MVNADTDTLDKNEFMVRLSSINTLSSIKSMDLKATKLEHVGPKMWVNLIRLLTSVTCLILPFYFFSNNLLLL